MAVCHVDEAAVLPLEEFGVLPDELRAAVEAAVATDERVSFVRVGLEEIFKEVDGVEAVAAGLEGLSVNGGNDADGKPPTGTLSPRERLVALFSRLDGRLSSKEDLLHHFRTALLARTARRLGCSHVFLGDSSGRIAVRALSLTIKGRGERMPLDVAAESRPFPGLTFLRPLRDVLPDEIAAFNRFRRLEPVAVPGVASAMPFKASIDRLTEHLVVGLQAEFPATTGAVYKTAYKVDTLTTRGKLVRYGPSGREQAVPVAGSFPACALCLGDVHPGDYGWRRDRTVESLDQIGTGPAADGEAHEGNGHQAGARGEPAHAPDDPGDLFRDLCYACQNIARDLAASAVPGRRDLRHSESAAAVAAMDLPPHSAAAIAANRAKMRAAVAEFLLEDDA
ncbi:hypothetical protein DFJ74DRAFT_689687 [Hyaloraphidium curvatum]|nr:hypothetical protein DFJ74DRAFT_689687 [Hyaloraphidium curvatum]